MVRIEISVEAFEAIALTLPLGSGGYGTNEQGERLIWLAPQPDWNASDAQSRPIFYSLPVMKALVSPAQAPPARRRRRAPDRRDFSRFPHGLRRRDRVSRFGSSRQSLRGASQRRERNVDHRLEHGCIHAALGRTAKEGVQVLRVDWPVYPRRAEHNTSPSAGSEWRAF